MKRSTLLWALAALNAVLLVALTWKLGGETPAHAQAPGRGDIMLVPGRAAQANSGIIYVLDTRNGVLTAVVYDGSRHQLNALTPLPLARFFEKR